MMHLFELASLEIEQRAASAPEWTQGCFRRRSITFFNGATDLETRVLWLQSNGLTADLRLLPGRPALRHRGELRDCTLGELVALAEAEGGLARTAWNGELMSWNDWTSFQSHAKWPEPGLLRRTGDCLVEFAPSGAYVEDWRFQAPGKGPLIGLELIEEVDATHGRVLHRGGGLVICGRHAAWVRGRPAPLPRGPAVVELVRREAGNDELLDAIFSFEASYATVDSSRGGFTVTASTSPWREGEPLLSLEGFSYDSGRHEVLQRTTEDGQEIARRFAVDTLRPVFEGKRGTGASPEAAAWLEREATTLLRYAQS